MKKLLYLSVILVFIPCLNSCTKIKEYQEQSKEKQMQKDAEAFIEFSQNASLLELVDFEGYHNGISNKYQGEDYLKFMKLLKQEVLRKKEQGIDCGILELKYLFDKDFQELDKLDEK